MITGLSQSIGLKDFNQWAPGTISRLLLYILDKPMKRITDSNCDTGDLLINLGPNNVSFLSPNQPESSKIPSLHLAKAQGANPKLYEHEPV